MHVGHVIAHQPWELSLSDTLNCGGNIQFKYGVVLAEYLFLAHGLCEEECVCILHETDFPLY